MEALTYDYELTPLSRVNVSNYAELTGSNKLKEILTDNMNILEYLPGRDFLDLLEEEPHKFKPDELLSVLRKNTPRMYSIASSQDAVGSASARIGCAVFSLWQEERRALFC